ncbi:MAG: FAD:protein FMN transferase [Desulfomonile tiedjei]|uniref:FAD:protein FMN transferase n=1 Tax=Desulfomonile tiedjei TaxID=2358 RepID=A0A9D6VAX8_9BACT|nr:FAD:protein FMN transferase [Desulfomonile tiedjei]
MSDHILLLGDDTVLVEYGPMRMFIDGSLHGVRQPKLCVQAAEKAIGFLEEIAAHRLSVQAPFHMLAEPPQQLLTHVMWEAVSSVADDDLTPMAAVAGTIADAVADFLEAEGLTKIAVNNGGDVAVRVKHGEALVVGIRPDVQKNSLSHRIVVTHDMQIGGICTSGLGGRSLTRGIASAATVFAARASVADAAATAVANATYVPSAAVHRASAESIDPNTDLRCVDITVDVDELTPGEIERGLTGGIRRAENLVERGLIKGACVAVKGRMACTQAIAPTIDTNLRSKKEELGRNFL